MNNVAFRAAVLCLALFAGPISAQTFALNESFALGVGKTLQLIDSNFSIKFVRVEYDGRCPTGVGCIWQGDAAVQFEIEADGSAQLITLHTVGGSHMPGTMEVLGHTVSLLSLAPYPRWQTITPPEAYVASLYVR